MPKIDISERNLTQATGTVGTDIPFIPGFANPVYNYRKATDTEREDTSIQKYLLTDGVYQTNLNGEYVRETVTPYEIPTLCNSVAQFEGLFGTEPYKFTKDITTHNIKQHSLDKSYIMAKELLNAGMPVYYWTPDVTGPYSTSAIKSVTDSSNLVINGSTVTLNGFKTQATSGIDIVINLIEEYPANTIFYLSCNDSRISLSDSRAEFTLISNKPNHYKLLSSSDAIGVRLSSSETFTEDELTLTFTLNMIEDINTSSSESIVDIFYNKLSTLFSSGELEDKGEYSIKYLTTGGYPNFTSDTSSKTYLATSMLDITSKRGDCVAILEYKESSSPNPNNTDSFYYALNHDVALKSKGSFGTAFTPWGDYVLTKKYPNNTKVVSLPACYGYLLDLATNIKTSPNWLAMAGVTRGLVPNLSKLNTLNGVRLSNTIADIYQPTLAAESTYGNASGLNIVALNAITEIKPYGLTIWGNRTLESVGEDGLTATNFLNTRNMISDIKKVAYRAAKAQLFEQNSEVLWLNFKAEVSPFLEQLKKGDGISDYKLLKLSTHYNGNSLGKEEFACAIQIFPLYAVESFEITVVVSDSDVSVE